ncbi:MAG: glycosyltransferase family 4 protein [Oscillospiraceae bacterium]|nr:glycosyltransferase family 4 protein [Oscillospiraceae bacterium]
MNSRGETRRFLVRILMLSWEYPPRIVGGISRVVHELSHELGSIGHDIHVVTIGESGQGAEVGPISVESSMNVTVHRINTYEIESKDFINWVMHMNFAFLEYAVGLIGRGGAFDAIHAHDWLVAFSAKVLKGIFGIPVISTIHSTEHGRNRGTHNELQRYISRVEGWLIAESSYIIVNSDYMMAEVTEFFGVGRDKVRVIRNGIDLVKFSGYGRSPAFRRNYAADEEKLVLFVGRLVNEKGAHVLIDAIPKVMQRYYGAKFVIAGRGSMLESLEARAKELGVGHKVCFTGYLSDENLSSLYKCSDIATFPSLYEPFGIVALEAIIAEVPVIVSDTGGLNEIIEDGVDGLKCRSGNADSLAECILRLLHRPELCDELKANALIKAHANYGWDMIAGQTLGVYAAAPTAGGPGQPKGDTAPGSVSSAGQT